MTMKELKALIKRIRQFESDGSCKDSTELAALSAERDDAVKRLSLDDDTANCIYLHVILGYSWQRIADIVNDGDVGLSENRDAIRARCKRYKW